MITADDLPVLERIEEILELVQTVGSVYVRYSKGPAVDADSVSVDKESGCALPGLSVNPITPEPWWNRDPLDWVARQLWQYGHLGDRSQVHPWLLSGTETGRGPDCEPLLTEITPLAVVGTRCLVAARERYQERFTPGQR